MKRALVLAALLVVGCDEAELEWSDEPGIEVCQLVVDQCADFCAEARDAGRNACEDEEYSSCSFGVRQGEGIAELVPGLHADLTTNVVLGWRRDCEDGLGFYQAWRYE